MILNFISGSKSPIGKHTLTILLLLSQSRKSFRVPKCAKENCYVVRAKAAPQTKRYPDLPHANINLVNYCVCAHVVHEFSVDFFGEAKLS